MASITKTTVNAALREAYTEPQVIDTSYVDNVAFGMVEKMPITNAKHYDFTVKLTRSQNRSATAATALGKVHTPVFIEFNVPPVGDFHADSISKEAILAAKSDEEAIDIAMDTVDALIQTISNQAGLDFFGERRGQRGTVGTYVGGATTFTLSRIEDVVNFEVGMVLRSSAAPTHASLRVGTNAITAVDRDTGVITSGVAWDTGITAFAATDDLYQDGDFNTKRAGWDDWNPAATTGLGAAFYGATRSSDPTRAAGIRVVGTGLPIMEAIRKLCSRAGREGWMPEMGFVGHDVFHRIGIELGNREPESEIRVTANGSATVGYSGYKVQGPKGVLEIFADRNAKDDIAYLTTKRAWKCIHYDTAPVRIDDDDGNILAREASDFTYDVRGHSFLNYSLRYTQEAGRVSLAAN